MIRPALFLTQKIDSGHRVRFKGDPMSEILKEGQMVRHKDAGLCIVLVPGDTLTIIQNTVTKKKYRVRNRDLLM